MVPLAPDDVGVNEVIVGAGTHVKPEAVAIPPGVVTTTLPEAPLLPTFIVIVVELTTVRLVPATPPNVTDVAPVNPVPVRVTAMPGPALVGVKEVMVGIGYHVNPARVAVPPMVVTDTNPVEPLPTTAVICVLETTVKDVAGTPPKLTDEAVDKLVPLIVTVAPGPAFTGVKEVIVGAGIKTNPGLNPVPPGVITAAFPEFPFPITAVI